MRKQRNKLKQEDLDKIQARFMKKYEEFSELPLHDKLAEDGTTVEVRGLRTRFREDKMSETDKRALVSVVDRRLKEQMAEYKKAQEEEELKSRENEIGEPVTSTGEPVGEGGE